MDEVLARTALSKSTLYKLLRQDKFPHPTPMSNRSIGWFEVDVENWLQGSKANRQANLALPVIYMAGKMGGPEDNQSQTAISLAGESSTFPDPVLAEIWELKARKPTC